MYEIYFVKLKVMKTENIKLDLGEKFGCWLWKLTLRNSPPSFTSTDVEFGSRWCHSTNFVSTGYFSGSSNLIVLELCGSDWKLCTVLCINQRIFQIFPDNSKTIKLELPLKYPARYPCNVASWKNVDWNEEHETWYQNWPEHQLKITNIFSFQST